MVKRLKFKKVVASLVVAASVLVLSPIGANAEWKHNSNGWWNTDKSYITDWQSIEGRDYFFSFEGKMLHDTTVDGYYLDKDGALDTSKGKSKLQDITMKSEKNVYPLGTKDINASITNDTSLESGYGTTYRIDKFEKNEWHHLDFSDDVEFEEVETILPSKGRISEKYKLSELKDFNNLTQGKYRIVKEIVNSAGYTHVTAEFELN